jgi:hypothetical protein
MESGHFEDLERPWRRLGQCPGGPAEMGENLVITAKSSIAAMTVRVLPLRYQCSVG